jgi:CBS domain containing-hemolysin-like protein
VSELWAILFSIFGVLLAGEIIPMAFFTGPKQIQIAELLCPVVIGLMYLTMPVSWPIAKLLDFLLGGHKI